MPTYTQKQRRIAIEVESLGKDDLLLTSITGEEEMSRLFHFELEMVSENDNLTASQVVGKKATFWVEYPDGNPRYFHGFINRFANCGRGDRLTNYRATVVPWLWFLTQAADCRIFQEQSVPDIIKAVFQKAGFNDFDAQIKGQHPKWEYCVQYRETHFNFVSRLMEHEGIFYYFKHEKGKHTLVLADQKTAYKDSEHATEKEIQLKSNLSAPELTDQLYRWEHQYQFHTGKWAENDFNFKEPSSSLLAKTSTVNVIANNTKYEIYDYPGEYEKKSDGDADIKLRMEADEVHADIVSGASHCRSFSPGTKFKVKAHHQKSEQGKGYVIVSVRHHTGMTGSYVAGGTSGESYSNSFTAIPDQTVFRAARITPKPAIHGAQTATVVGPSGEEIWPDEYGRVKVQFHWDREGKKDDKSSCWIRVAHPWTGKNWGMVSIPRVGQEVVVSYLEGDPDQPLVTGMVYNAMTMPPYDLPANKTQTGIKTRSTKQGGSDNFNELRFEDKKGSEDIFFHAEKDFHREVEHDDDLKVDNNQTEKIKNDRKVEISMGNDSLNIKMGNQSTKIDLGKSETEAMQSIELKVGQSSIKVDQMGITMKGMMISVEGQIQTQVKGLMTQVTADAILQVKGGLTMIG